MTGSAPTNAPASGILAPNPSLHPNPQSAAHQVRAQLAQIVREETDDGRTAVQFLVNVMQGELADFKPCHRLSAAKELLQRGFDYVPEETEAQLAAEPEPDPAELLAQLHLAEDIEFSKHGPVYYKTYPYPCVCEDRLHDCKGNVLTEEERSHTARKAPGMQSFLDEPHRIRDYLERYAEYLGWWNTEHPGNPVDIKRIHWTAKRWQHLNPVGSINPAEALNASAAPDPVHPAFKPPDCNAAGKLPPSPRCANLSRAGRNTGGRKNSWRP